MEIRREKVTINRNEYIYYPLSQLGPEVNNLPYSIKILLENVLKNYDNSEINDKTIENILKLRYGSDIAFKPSRVVLQDYTGIPLIVDLAALREYYKKKSLDPEKINPVTKSDLIIDHSIIVDSFGNGDSIVINMKDEFSRNIERYKFLKWAMESFKNLSIVPPGHGIIHQINLEYLSRVAFSENNVMTAESLIGTDSHTTMIGGIGVLGWGVGGLEAEASMLGEPYYMVLPEVIGVKIIGDIKEGVTTTDIVLYITNKLRARNVVGKFVEFFGDINKLTVQDRATISNMAPEYGATIGYFPVDDETIKYINNTNRDGETVKEFFKLQGLFYDGPKNYSDVVEIDLGDIVPSMAGPKNPDELVTLDHLKENVEKIIEGGHDGDVVKNGSVVISAITSCTNTSNPTVLLGAGILAKKAYNLGLFPLDYVKTSLAPGSQVVTEYLKNTGLLEYLEKLNFYVVGYGCTTCIGNAGPLIPAVENDIKKNNVKTFAVLSGNRNFEGRINPYIAGAYLASPILVAAMAIAGRLNFDPYKEPIAKDKNGNNVYLKDIWPTLDEIKEYINMANDPKLYKERYKDVFSGDSNWNSLSSVNDVLYNFDDKSTYIKIPPWLYLEPVKDIKNGRILAIFGDKVTTDHISPAGPILKESVAGKYLMSLGATEMNTFGARRGNHEVMLRGGFSNPKLRNLMSDENGYTIHYPDGKKMTIYDAAMKYRDENVPLVIFAGKQYGSGSSRDWAAKVTALMNIKAVIAESFERIHRSNLVDMGVVPIQIDKKPELKGDEIIEINGLEDLKPGMDITIKINGMALNGKVRVDTEQEVKYIKSGNILKYIAEKN
ncbi:aconitate hydratase AcnA [Picrophilus oshimae]|uniref:Aconitase n=1 Tax=Picrophilus torridus (strain ATCC 700027 / DSM 9790 / JCM 10055 / NBRC 100828 / KAW 2/3) TaxID=1122961 RepID=A0A8G2FVE5_PICTO|nr:aconitate hydratase AcnA [Picrophilus oshimae]SMD30168.1 aconitase [Picrophilus oshimae DSM 9789]